MRARLVRKDKERGAQHTCAGYGGGMHVDLQDVLLQHHPHAHMHWLLPRAEVPGLLPRLQLRGDAVARLLPVVGDLACPDDLGGDAEVHCDLLQVLDAELLAREYEALRVDVRRDVEQLDAPGCEERLPPLRRKIFDVAGVELVSSEESDEPAIPDALSLRLPHAGRAQQLHALFSELLHLHHVLVALSHLVLPPLLPLGVIVDRREVVAAAVAVVFLDEAFARLPLVSSHRSFPARRHVFVAPVCRLVFWPTGSNRISNKWPV